MFSDKVDKNKGISEGKSWGLQQLLPIKTLTRLTGKKKFVNDEKEISVTAAQSDLGSDLDPSVDLPVMKTATMDAEISVEDDQELADDADDELAVESNECSAIPVDDPLDQAYDLEHGAPIRDEEETAPRKGLPSKSKVTSAKEFFNTEFIYRFDILEDESRANHKGSYRFELKGFQGGIWTILIDNNLEVVNRREEAEIVFTMQQSDFVHIANGDLNPQLAILAKKLRITGSMRKAINLLNLLVPGID